MEDKVSQAKAKINPKCMKIANLVAGALILVGIILRFVYLFTIKFNFLFLILTIYLIIFNVVFILAVLQNAHILYYVRFLNGGRGLGLFMIFICLLVLGRDEAVEVICTIAVLIIALINICFGALAHVPVDINNPSASSS